MMSGEWCAVPVVHEDHDGVCVSAVSAVNVKGQKGNKSVQAIRCGKGFMGIQKRSPH